MVIPSANFIYLSAIANVLTIIGASTAIYAYTKWKDDYKRQKSHDYAINLLNKIKLIHYDLENFRHHIKYMEGPNIKEMELFIQDFKDCIIPQILDINSNLLVADKILITHKNFQSKFIEIFHGTILSPIDVSINKFHAEKHQHDFDIGQCEIYRLFFPLHVDLNQFEIKKSILGTQVSILDNDFNRVMERGFSELYGYLQANLS